MTEKLYYEDSFLQEFTASVTGCEKTKDGWEVVLDRTAFYPEGGGQPADHGQLGGAAVSDVREREGVIYHTCNQALEVGSQVEGRIDFARRFDFMQQHSAELTTDDVREVERLANQYIWEDHPIDVMWPSQAELDALQYRSKKALTGAVQIVAWPGADCCACCGTHVCSSGQVGSVKLISCQKFREGVRIEMAAGGRALNYFNIIAQQNLQISQLLSAKPAATAAAVERMQRELYTLRGRVMALEEGDFARKAEQYAGAGDVLLLEDAMSTESIRKLCAAVQESAGGRCAVFAGADGVYQYAVSQPGGDLRALAKEINTVLHGRGGGKPAFIQGSVQAPAEDIQRFFG